MFNGCLPDIGIIILAVFPDRGVDNQVDLLVVDGINDIGSSFVDLFDEGRVDAIGAQELVGVVSGQYLEPDALKKFCYGQDLFLVFLLYRDQHCSACG